MPMNPATGTGWKKDSDIPCKKDKEVVECIEKNAYLADEVLVNIGSSFQVMDFFHDTLNAMWKMLNFNPGHLGESVTQTQRLKIRYFWNFIFCHLNIVRV